MTAMFCRIMTLLAMMFATTTGAMAQAPGERHLAMQLVAESVTPAPGTTVTLAIAATPQPGWHGYWQNPGDAGLPTQAAWTLPDGAGAGALRYPVPERLIVAGLMNYVFERPYAMLVDLKLPPGMVAGTALPVKVRLDYLVCTQQVCVPESQTLATMLRVGDGAISADTRIRFDRWRQALPRPLGSAATYQVEDKALRLAVPFPADAALGEAYFYPAAGGIIDMAAPQTVTRTGDRLVIATAAATPAPAGRIEGSWPPATDADWRSSPVPVRWRGPPAVAAPAGARRWRHSRARCWAG